tara:strand:- start:654 stop:1349 length:696 start_codon:yes stop_codon:yes gene_type:complete
MTQETAVNETEQTASPQEQQVDTQEQKTEATLTQDDVNRIVAERVAREKAKFEKKYSGVDLDHYKTLVEADEKARTEELEKRGEFEKVLKEQADKFNSKIHQYENELHSIKVDGALLNEASSQKAINPQQVVQLLKNQVKLNDAGGVDVVDTNGQVRYDDNGNPLTPNALVKDWLKANPHFVQAGPTGSGTGQGIGKQTPVVDNDISKLDMNNPKHRDQYREIMKAKGVRL